jgi:hypothetical protein
MSRSLLLPAGVIDDYVYSDDSGTAWEDIQAPVVVGPNSPNTPAYVPWDVQGSIGKFYGYKFNSGPLNGTITAFSNVHLPHTYSVKNSGAYIHLHLVNLFNGVVSAPNNVCRFLIEVSYAKTESVWSAVESQEIIFNYPSNLGYLHLIRETTNPFFAGQLEPDALITVRITREKGNVVDTCDQDFVLLYIDAHVEVGKFATLYRNKNIGGSFYG